MIPAGNIRIFKIAYTCDTCVWEYNLGNYVSCEQGTDLLTTRLPPGHSVWDLICSLRPGLYLLICIRPPK